MTKAIITKALKHLNMRKQEINILTWLITNKQGTSRDIEHDLYLPQPEVSTYTRTLLEKKLITRNIHKDNTKGRPYYTYHPNPDALNRLSLLLEQKLTEDQQTLEKVKELKELI